MEEVRIKNLGNVDAGNKVEDKKKVEAKQWQKPTLEDVSEKIMAQPYIRFT